MAKKVRRHIVGKNATAAQEDSMVIDIRGLAPLLEVFDMPASIRFYCDVLGFELDRTSAPGDHFGWAGLRLNGVELMLNTAYEEGQRPPVPDPARVASHADTALFFGCEDLAGAYRHLRAHGLDVQAPVVQSYGMKQLYVRDPDGYTLCFQWPATQQTYDDWQKRYGLPPKIVEDAAPGA
jgi:glyoxylase I family protein